MELYSEIVDRNLFSFPAVRLNENCTDLDLGELCSAECSERVRSCLAFCAPGDVSCENSCIRQGFDCVDGCPCHADCFEGCDDCAADICNVCFEPGENPDYKTCLNQLELDLIQCLNDCSGSSTCVIQVILLIYCKYAQPNLSATRTSLRTSKTVHVNLVALMDVHVQITTVPRSTLQFLRSS